MHFDPLWRVDNVTARPAGAVEAVQLSDNLRLIPDQVRAQLAHGADELDLVRSGLEDTMRLAFGELHETLTQNETVEDLRTAAYVVSLNKIARTYLDLGIY